jgi:hypothetical protein
MNMTTVNKEWNVIPDIHADPTRLDATLAYLGGDDKLAFLGDLIDAGAKVNAPDDGAVLKRVRSLIEDKGAVSVMGNHEMNAILFHRRGEDGLPMRTHEKKNKDQHASFIEQFGVETKAVKAWTDWFLTLPLWLDLGGIRLVHAYWDQSAIDIIKLRRPDGLLREEDLPEIATKSTDFGQAVDSLLSGPELALPKDCVIHDYKMVPRDNVRIAWWRPQARTWQHACLSVPNLSELPDENLPENHGVAFYPDTALPVFVGHYKMKGKPKVETVRVACLDYPDAPCVYCWRGESDLRNSSLYRVPGS